MDQAIDKLQRSPVSLSWNCRVRHRKRFLGEEDIELNRPTIAISLPDHGNIDMDTLRNVARRYPIGRAGCSNVLSMPAPNEDMIRADDFIWRIPGCGFFEGEVLALHLGSPAWPGF
jgi:hypothetical protein